MHLARSDDLPAPEHDERGLTALARSPEFGLVAGANHDLGGIRGDASPPAGAVRQPWESIWFRRSPPVGQLVAGSRIPIQVLAAPNQGR